MVQLSIELPDDVGDRLRLVARASNHPSLEAFAKAMLIAEVDVDHGAPASLSFDSQDELEEMLERRLENSAPSIEGSHELWQQIKQRVLGKKP